MKKLAKSWFRLRRRHRRHSFIEIKSETFFMLELTGGSFFKICAHPHREAQALDNFAPLKNFRAVGLRSELRDKMKRKKKE
jgi:hypothetical protein